MESRLKSKLGFTLFFLIVIFLIVGGYIYMKYFINEKKLEKEQKEIEKINYKIYKEKNYIYYINESVLSESAEIDYKDVVINLNIAKSINESLEKENNMYKENIKYISDHKDEILSDDLIVDNDNIYSMTFRNYLNYEFGKFISLVVNEYNYSCFGGSVTYNRSITYVFNVDNNELLSDDEILNMYNINMDKIKEKVREYLNSKQSIIDEVEVIKIDETIDNLEYSLFIDDYGKLNVSFLVKTTQVDYNEIMEV